MASLKVQEPVPHDDAEVNRPGSHYKQWRREEDLTENAKTFCEATSKLVGISVERLVRIVFRTEMKLRAWAMDQAR